MASTILISLSKLAAKVASSFTSTPASDVVASELDKLKSAVSDIHRLLADLEKREIREESVKFWLFELKQFAYDAEDILSDVDSQILCSKLERSLHLNTHKRKRETKSSSSSSSSSSSIFPFFGSSSQEEHVNNPKRPMHQISSPFANFKAKQVACEADVTMSYLDYDMMQIDIGNREEEQEVIDLIPSPLLDATFVRELVPRIKRVMERFDEIKRDRVALSLRPEDGAKRAQATLQRETTAIAEQPEIIGRENDKNKIVEALLSNDAVQVVSIVAMAGMGKTTLARLVYNDVRVTEHFKLKSWIWVSQSYDATRLLTAIIQSVTGQECSLSDLGKLQNRLMRVLSGKKFFLVLDDIWNEDPILWKALQEPLISSGRGSRVMITTRSENVSSVMGASLFRLNHLSMSQSWELFYKHAFECNGSVAHPSLVEVGSEIVKKCKGVPLMLVTLGGLLSSETSREIWDEILLSDLWDIDEGEEKVLEVLKLSYQHLPAYIKPCFTYCAVFPKGHEFEMESLVRMWVAQGFIQTDDAKQMEETGRMYVHDLLRRSLFHNQSYFDYKLNFAIHDLIHDMAKWIAGEETNIVETLSSHCITSKKFVRHLSVLVNTEVSVSFEMNHEHDALRSLVLVPGWRNDFRLERKFFEWTGMRYLRVLELQGSGVPELPEEVANLKHLRYLGLSGARIKRLPESISCLYSLQTLDLQFCNNLVELPKGVKDLINLRHLVVHSKYTAPSFVSFLFRGEKLMMPAGIGNLTALQTLPLLALSRDKAYARISELKDLNDLRGKLSIVDLHNITHAHRGEAKEANLRSKKCLTWLVLKWHTSMSFIDSRDEDDKEVLESLQPHTNIEIIEIEGYKFSLFPNWLCDPSFSKLVEVSLSHCVNCEKLPALGQLPSLKLLDVFHMHSLRCIGPEFYGENKVSFPSLQSLRLKMLPNWEEWLHKSEERIAFPCLQSLTISACGKLASLSLYNFLALQVLRVDKCDQLRAVHGLDVCWFVAKEKSSLHSMDTSISEHQLPAKIRTVEFTACPSLPELCKSHAKELSELSENRKNLIHGRRSSSQQ
ncbi:putative disease resistance protein RGA3 [Typha angustifolia]|uniref:putative disease resistance protein RGA3 n=1 Tax=Typha angustifolia TaxID=59011 RepID=UPI003C2BF004